jgi:8-oxo-dGTP diphosphatase
MSTQNVTVPQGVPKSVIVAAGVIIEHGKVLVSRRKAGTHLEGVWEFPGGKVEPGEDPRDTVRRELHEELGVTCVAGEILDVTFHHYPEAHKSVLLLFFACTRAPQSAAPQALDVAEVAWFGPGDLTDSAFPPADLAVLRKVRALLDAAS